MSRIYLDHAASSPLRDAAWEAMGAARGAADYNAASTHSFGRSAGDRLEEARRALADLLGAPRGRVHFTGGGTQSDNLAVLGFARAHAGANPRLLVSAVEHKAVLYAAERAAEEGAEVNRIPVDADGTVRLEELELTLAGGDDRPTLVSVMWANNEVGTVQPVAEACELAHRHGALFHTDAVQALGKVEVSLEEVPADLLSATAHKLGGPVGVGLLYAAEGAEVEPLAYGGSQERGLWPGTQNPVGAAGFAAAARAAVEEVPEKAPRWRQLRDGLQEKLREEIPDLRVRAEGAERRLPHLLNVGIPGCDQSALLVSMDMEGVAISSGSACSSGAVEPSHVLEAMGEPGPTEVGTLRFSFGPDTAAEEVERAGDAAVRVAARLREEAEAPAREPAPTRTPNP